MTDRQIDNLIKPATIADTDPASNRVRAQHGGMTTDWLPYIVPFAGGVSVWRIPSVGEACTILSPAGEPENGVVLCGQASDRYPAPSADPAETVVRFPDGAHIRYNHQSGAMELKAVTSLTIDTPQTTITGHLTVNQTTTVQGLLTYQNGMNGQGGSGGGGTNINGNINHNGTLTNAGAVVSNGISLSDHTHPGDSGGTTGKPR